MRTSRFFLSLLAVAALAQTAAAQRSGQEWVEQCRRNNNRHNGNRVTHCEVREVRIPARGSLRVDARENGGVSVRTHPGRDIVVQSRVQTHARSDAAARELAGRIRVDTDGTIRATGPDERGREGWAVSYDILVPARTNLEVEAHNGPISVSSVSGNMDLRTENGPITLSELAGDVEARTQNGPVTVTLAGRRWSGEGLDVETVNGPVTVRMPRGYAAHLESSTVHGPINAPGNLRPQRRERWSPGGRISADVNGGGPTIRAVTTNGPVNIQEN
jgi:hypothetical protein